MTANSLSFLPHCNDKPTAPLANVVNKPNMIEPEDQRDWVSLAQKHWAKPVKTKKIKIEVIKTELWDVLEQRNFDYQSLLILESLRLLEK